MTCIYRGILNKQASLRCQVSAVPPGDKAPCNLVLSLSKEWCLLMGEKTLKRAKSFQSSH